MKKLLITLLVTLGLVVGAVASERDTTYNIYGVSAKTDRNQDSTVGIGFMYDSEVFKAKLEGTSDFTKLGLVYKYSPLTDLYFKFGGNYINQRLYAPDSSNTRVNQYSGALAVGYMLKDDIYAEIGGAVTKLNGKVFGDYEIVDESTSIVYGELVKRWLAGSVVIDTTANFGKVFHEYSDDETTYGLGLDIYPTSDVRLGGGYYYENHNKAYNLSFTYRAFFVEYSKNISADTYQANLGVKFTCKDVWSFSGCKAPTNIVKDISELHRFEDISFSTNMEIQSNEGVRMTQVAKDRIEAERIRAEEEAIANAISPVLTFGDLTFTTTAGVALVLADVVAIDNLDGVIPVVISGDVVDFDVEGVYNVIYTATDSNGNVSTITHTYNVGQALDVESPILDNHTQTFTTTVGSALVLATVTATDVVDGNVAVVTGGDVVNFNAIGTYNVTYTATDVAGNSVSITHSYVVNAVPVVVDNVAPVLDNHTQTFTTTVGNALVLATVTATDVVDGAVAVVTGGDVVNFNAIGTYNVTYTATDVAGNSKSITHTYVVNPVPISTPSINAIGVQAVTDWGGAVATTILTVSGSDINVGAVFSIVANPTSGNLTINSSTGELIWDGNINPTASYSITVKVLNTDGGSDTETFTLNVTDNG